MPAPPPGYAWESAPVDSGCTTLLKTSSRGFSNINTNSARSVRIANDAVLPVEGEGTFNFTLMSKQGELFPFSAKDSVYSAQLRDLISSGMFEDMGHRAIFDGAASEITLRVGEPVRDVQIPLRCEGRLRYLDYLVPLNPSEHAPTHVLAAEMVDDGIIKDKTAIKEFRKLGILNHADIQRYAALLGDVGETTIPMGNKGATDVVPRLYAEPATGVKSINVPNVRDPAYLMHRRLCHVGDEMFGQTVPAVDGLPR